MRLLFVFRDPGRVRYFETALELLAARGHELRLVVESPRERLPGQLDFSEDLARRHEGVTLVKAPKRARTRWSAAARSLRLALDFLHYRQPAFDGAPDFRARSAADAPGWVVRLARLPGATAVLRRLLGALERALPVSREVEAELDAAAPDVVAVTPYVWFGAAQTDWVRAARRRGIHTAACMFSWDNLTSKGSVREVPELLTVWNEVQRGEASDLHGIPPERIAVTGAQNWDHWFGWRATRDREAFCREAGLDPARPFVLWLESSGYVGGEEDFVGEWIARLRADGGERTRAASVLIRPHPQMTEEHWAGSDVRRLDDVAVFPAAGQVPLDAPSRADFYDSLHHCAAVAGVNTSAFIESAIVGRPCLTLELDRFRRGQANTLHFHHLVERNGGPLIVATTWEEHLAQLEAALDGGGTPDRARAFVERFVRPHGTGEAAAPRLVAALEELAAR